MHAIEERYYKLNRIFLKLLGLWPYQQSYLVRIQKVLCAGVLLSFIIVQLLILVTNQYNLAFLLKILSLVFPTIFVTIKYCLFAIQKENVKQLLEQIRNHWGLMVDKLEIGIIERYACNARFFTLIAMVFCHVVIFFSAVAQFLPLILDIILPLNESRPLHLIVITDYFVDQEKYFYIILFHIMLTGLVGIIAICITTATIMMYILHICALFQVASYRIENVIDKDILEYSNAVKTYLLYRRILHAVAIHRKAIEFMETFTSSFAMSYDVLIIVGVTSLSINLFQFLQLITLTNNMDETFIVAVLILLHLNYMFALNYGGQEVMNHGKILFTAIYNGLWYTTPLHTQKLLLFMMQKCAIDVILTMGSLFVASLEGLASLISMALSYFTVIYSTR